MSYAILIGREILRFPGCRTQYIKNISSFKADHAIRNRFGSVRESHLWDTGMNSFHRMLNGLRNRVEYSR